MKRLTITLGISFAVLWIVLVGSSMAQEGFIKPLPPEPADKDLPPEAQNLRHEVLHQVSSMENLHLLAAYYYGDPRQWAKIYHANRGKIKNPNRLQIGQILRIPVQRGWSPRYNYEEWFQLATRGGEWAPKSARGPAVTSPEVEPSIKREEPQVERPQLEREEPKVEQPPLEEPQFGAPKETQPPAEKKEGPIEM
jgi:hypothetical protein